MLLFLLVLQTVFALGWGYLIGLKRGRDLEDELAPLYRSLGEQVGKTFDNIWQSGGRIQVTWPDGSVDQCPSEDASPEATTGQSLHRALSGALGRWTGRSG